MSCCYYTSLSCFVDGSSMNQLIDLQCNSRKKKKTENLLTSCFLIKPPASLSLFLTFSEYLTPPSPFPTRSLSSSTGMLWQGVAVCYAGLYSPSAYYPVRLNTQVETKGYAWKLQPTSLSTQHNSLTRVKTRVCAQPSYALVYESPEETLKYNLLCLIIFFNCTRWNYWTGKWIHCYTGWYFYFSVEFLCFFL